MPWLFSLTLHAAFLLWWSTPSSDPSTFTPPPLSEPIVISEAPPADKRGEKTKPPTATKEPEMAETEDSKNKELDPEARFLSDRNQKADHETRARLTDDFRKKQGTGLQSKQGSSHPPPTGSGKANVLDQSDSATDVLDPNMKSKAGAKRDWKTLSLKDLGISGHGGLEAATDDRVNGVDAGDETVLSTREFKYFSYYHRIKEMLRQYWKPNVERKLAMLWGKGKNLGEEEITTKLLVLLDQNGTVQKISKLNSSGISDLDDAAIEAFQRAAPFPNPPKGIVDEDGFVRIRWDFILKTEAVPRIQFRNVGNPSGMR